MHRLTVLAALAITFPHAGSAQRTSDGAVAFVDVNVVSMASERILPGQTVVVRNGVIAEMGPASRIKIPAGATLVPAAGKYLMPGLMDLHVHMAGPRDMQLALLKLYVANGVTTILNARGAPEHLTLRAAIAKGDVFGPTLYTVGPYVYEPFVSTPDEVERAVVEQKRAGYDFIKMHGELSREAYARLIAVGRREGIRIIGHAPRTLGIEVVTEERQYALMHAEEYLYDRKNSSRDFAQLEPRIPELARAAAATGLWIMPNLTAYKSIAMQIINLDSMLARPAMRFLPPAVRDGWGPATNAYVLRFGKDRGPGILDRYAMLEKLVRGFKAAGVRMLIGTDALNTGVVPGFSAAEELEDLVTAGLTPYEALRAATVNGAEFLGVGNRQGTVAVGKRADLLLLEQNPLSDVRNVRRRAGVMLRGRWMPESELRGMLEALVRSYARP